MWQLAVLRRAGEAPINSPQTNLFFLPPSLGRVIEGGPLEDVLLMRDEMANLAWAIERSTESPVEQAVQRIESGAASTPPSAAVDALAHYVLVVHGAGQLDPTAAGATGVAGRQGRPATQARCRAATRRLDEDPSRPGISSQCRHRTAALRRGGTARGGACHSQPTDGTMDRRVQLGLDVVPQAGRARRRIERFAFRSGGGRRRG